MSQWLLDLTSSQDHKVINALEHALRTPDVFSFLLEQAGALEQGKSDLFAISLELWKVLLALLDPQKANVFAKARDFIMRICGDLPEFMPSVFVESLTLASLTTSSVDVASACLTAISTVASKVIAQRFPDGTMLPDMKRLQTLLGNTSMHNLLLRTAFPEDSDDRQNTFTANMAHAAHVQSWLKHAVLGCMLHLYTACSSIRHLPPSLQDIMNHAAQLGSMQPLRATGVVAATLQSLDDKATWTVNVLVLVLTACQTIAAQRRLAYHVVAEMDKPIQMLGTALKSIGADGLALLVGEAQATRVAKDLMKDIIDMDDVNVSMTGTHVA